MNKTYFVAGFTAMMTLGYSKSFAFETTTVKIRCWEGDTAIYADSYCISATRTEDFYTGTNGYIDCLCPDDPTKLRKSTCQSYWANGRYLFRWYHDSCRPCDSGQYNNGGSCSSCPAQYTSDTGAVSANECYKKADVERSDETGTFIFTDNCYYDGATSSPVENSYKTYAGEEEASSTTTTE
ncbi:MAG: hypothetical protein E7009_01910 [Alphaproteobacteria bacterium]|nr:hypothetical protein [Alphaproteobacteria bacterium]